MHMAPTISDESRTCPTLIVGVVGGYVARVASVIKDKRSIDERANRAKTYRITRPCQSSHIDTLSTVYVLACVNEVISVLIWTVQIIYNYPTIQTK
jgi:hypothetical protein